MSGFAYDQDSGKIKGGTDETVIGNVSDALKVTTVGTAVVSDVEPATFIAVASSVAIGNGKSMISLLNASGSAVTVKILNIYLINTQTSAVTGVIADFSLFRCTGHSAGTAITTTTMLTTDSLNASVTARTGATITGEIATPLRRVLWSSDEWGVGGTDVENAQNAAQYQSAFWSNFVRGKRLTLLAGEGVTLKQTVNSTAGTFDVQIIFTQE